MGLSNAKLSYYDGMIQLNYRDGTPYNNEKHTPRATLITFLCDRDAGVGLPEYQVGTVRRVGVRHHGELGGRERSPVEVGERKTTGRTGLVTFWREVRLQPQVKCEFWPFLGMNH